MPVIEFLDSLSVKERVKCRQYIDALVEFGNSLPSNYIKHIEKGLWELRPEFGGAEFRLFYFILAADNRIFMLHAIKKKTQKTPRKEIDLALKRKAELE
jgi:phage-related protein